MTYRLAHPPHLALAPFVNANLEIGPLCGIAACSKQLDMRGQRHSIVEFDSPTKPLEIFFGGNAFDAGDVALLDVAFGMEQAMAQLEAAVKAL